MELFSTFQMPRCAAIGCAALLFATPYVAAMPLSHTHATDAVAGSTWAADTDPGGRIYAELLDMQDKAIDQAAVAVEAAHAQHTRLVFALSILVTVMGAICAWLVLANPAGHWMAPRTGT